MIALLLSHDIDLLAHVLVLALKLVELYETLVQSVLEHLALVLAVSDLSGGRQLVEVLLLSLELLAGLLVLILKDHEALLLVLEVLGEVISLTLQSLGLALKARAKLHSIPNKKGQIGNAFKFGNVDFTHLEFSE